MRKRELASWAIAGPEAPTATKRMPATSAPTARSRRGRVHAAADHPAPLATVAMMEKS
jgi:hypothetical protein